MRIERGLGQIRELGRQDDPFAIRVGDRHVPRADRSGRNNTHDRRAVVGHNPNGELAAVDAAIEPLQKLIDE